MASLVNPDGATPSAVPTIAYLTDDQTRTPAGRQLDVDGLPTEPPPFCVALDEAQALAALQLSPDSRPVHRHYWGLSFGRKWRDYQMCRFGTEVDAGLWIIWLEGIWDGRSPLFLEWRGAPPMDHGLAIRGIEQAHTVDDLLRTWQGRALRKPSPLHKTQGRPARTRQWSREALLARAPAAFRRCEELHPHPPTQLELATEMGIPYPSFLRYCRLYGLDWSQWQTELLSSK